MPRNLLWLDVTEPGVPDRPPDLIEEVPVPVCDFCSSPAPVASYECPDFSTQGTHPDGQREEYVSRGAWFACAACASLIDHNKLRALIRRSVRRLERRYPDRPRRDMEYLAGQVALQYRSFFDLRRLEGITGRQQGEPPPCPG